MYYSLLDPSTSHFGRGVIMPKLSIIVPCYNEEETLPYFWKEMQTVADDMFTQKDILFEFIFVNDGSRDGTLNLLKDISAKDKRVHYLSFSRNFGKEAALCAGLRCSKGDYVAVMDADLQDPPALLPQMYDALQSGVYDCVATRRVDRKGEPPIRSFFARIFYKLINKISGVEIIDGARDFRLMTRKMVNAILDVGEYNRFSKGIFGWVGFQTKWLPYENTERVAGKTKWSFWKLLLYAFDGIIAYSTVPLAIASVLGILFCIAALIWMVTIFVKTLIWGDPVAGFPTLACLLLLIGGSIQLSLGIIGQYLAKTYLETKRRPIYIISETDMENDFEKIG